jgi:hypothetical protein
MRPTAALWASCLALAVTNCSETVRAPLTIVVDTDLVRAREERGRLEAVRAGVQGDRAGLEVARTELERARRRLEQTTPTGPNREALLTEIRALEARVCPSTALAADDVAAAVAAGVEAGVAAGVASALAASPSSSASARPMPPAAPSATSPTPLDPPSAPMVRALVAEARALARARRVDLADVAGSVVALERIESLLQRGEHAAAHELAVVVQEQARRVVVDRALLLRRYERLNALVRQQGDAALRDRALTPLRRASEALSRGALDDATAALVEVAELIAPGSDGG